MKRKMGGGQIFLAVNGYLVPKILSSSDFKIYLKSLNFRKS